MERFDSLGNEAAKMAVRQTTCLTGLHSDGRRRMRCLYRTLKRRRENGENRLRNFGWMVKSASLGAAGGIELACARPWPLADLILADIMEAELEAAGEQIQELGVRCRTVVCDVSDLMAVEALTECVKDFGGADILIHSAAITNRKQL